jgi:hypothetical protein
MKLLVIPTNPSASLINSGLFSTGSLPIRHDRVRPTTKGDANIVDFNQRRAEAKDLQPGDLVRPRYHEYELQDPTPVAAWGIVVANYDDRLFFIVSDEWC